MPSFEEAAAAVFEQKRGGWRNEKHRKDWPTSLRLYEFPQLGDKPVSEITSADLLKVLAPDAHLTSDDIGVAGECALPVSMVEHHDRMPAARDFVARQQGASDGRLDAQHREVAAGDRLRRRQADASTRPGARL